MISKREFSTKLKNSISSFRNYLDEIKKKGIEGDSFFDIMKEADTKGYITYAKDRGISDAKAAEYWEIASKSVKDQTGKNKDELDDSDWEHIFGIFKKIIDNASNKKKESLVTTTKAYILEGVLIPAGIKIKIQ